MSDLISKSKLLDTLIHCKELERRSFEAVIKTVNEQPTVEPVRGEWTDKGWDEDFSCRIYARGNGWKVAQCSICGHELRVNQKTNFCANCGADMRKKVEE